MRKGKSPTKRNDVQKVVSWMNLQYSTINFFGAGLVACGCIIHKKQQGADEPLDFG
jgi:hypothetical protein